MRHLGAYVTLDYGSDNYRDIYREWAKAVIDYREKFKHPSGVGLYIGKGIASYHTIRIYCEVGQDYGEALAEALMLRTSQSIIIHVAETKS